MTEAKEQVQKNLVNFCTYLIEHVEKWKLALQNSESAIRALNNQAEQLRHVDRTDLIDVEGFNEMKDSLKFSVYNGIEEEIATIKDVMERLSKANNLLKSKLFTFEKSSVDINWDERNWLINGNATQPPLSKILSGGLEFWQYFNKSLQTITNTFKLLDLKCAKSVASFVAAFDLDLDTDCLREIVALTQYVNNPDAIN